MAHRKRKNGRQEAAKRLLGDGWRERWSPGAFFIFWGRFSPYVSIVFDLFFFCFGACCPPHFRDVFWVPRVAEIVFVWIARKRAPMLKLLAPPTHFHVF